MTPQLFRYHPRAQIQLIRPVDVCDTSAFQPPQAHVQLTRPVDVRDVGAVRPPGQRLVRSGHVEGNSETVKLKKKLHF